MPEYRLTEEDVKNQFITPSIEKKNWKKTQIHMEYAFTAGRINVFGNKAERNKYTIKKVDYLLTTKVNEIKIVIVEAKAPHFSVSHGIQQALNYAQMLDVPFVYSTLIPLPPLSEQKRIVQRLDELLPLCEQLE